VEIYELHARICKAIADPKRLLIINALRDGERNVGDVATALGISQPNASQHLAVLRDRGIVRTRRDGNTVFYALTSQKVIRAVDLLREFMAERYANDRVRALTG
jgi:ArsR family transcriptional regulator